MDKLSFFDRRVFEAMQRAPSDPDEAAQLLTLAAEYLRKSKPMPHDLADFIAGAFEIAAAKQPKERARCLGHELHLTAQNRRPVKAGYLEVGQAFERMMDEGNSQNQAKECVAADFEISESTALKLYRKYKLAIEEADRVVREEYSDLE